jgi:hypothetical protein
MASISNPEPSPIPSVSQWEGRQSADYFGHTVALQAGLAGMLAIALVTFALVLKLPLTNSWLTVAIVPALLIGYLGLRLYLTFSSVEFFSDRVDIHVPGRAISLPYDSIRHIRFDSFSHDLMVRDDNGEYRIPRTIQGHRAILHRLHQHVEVERDHSPEMDIRIRALPRFTGALAIIAMLLITTTLLIQMPQIGLGLLIVSLPTAYLLLDQCVLRSYRLTPEALHVKGLRSRSYLRSNLQEAWISKSGLSSRLEMKFSTGAPVQMDEYLLSKALIQVSGYVERRWQQRVKPLSKKA